LTKLLPKFGGLLFWNTVYIRGYVTTTNGVNACISGAAAVSLWSTSGDC